MLTVPETALGGEIVLRLMSPPFQTRPPQVIYPERVPRDAAAAMDRIWSEPEVKAAPLTVVLLKDVYVVGDGIVFDSNRNVFEPAVWPSTAENVARARQLLELGLGGTIPVHDRRAVLAKKPGYRNYGHWLVEMLPRVLICRDRIAPDVAALVHGVEEPLQTVMQRSFELAGVPQSDVIETGQGPVLCRELLVVLGLTRHGRYMSPLAVRALDRLSAAVPGAGHGPRLYVRRATPASRQLDNEEEILPRLQELGYVSVEPGKMSLDEQIRTFRDARSIVGIMGAELTNTVFCRPGANVIALVPQGMPDTFFWFLAQHRGLSFNEIRCLTNGTLEGRSWHKNILLAAEDIDVIRRLQQPA